MLQFTKEIKNNWLNNLKSGNFTQAFKCFHGNGTHCCIAVLDETIKNHPEYNENKSQAFDILRDVKLGTTGILISTNDDSEYIITGKTDYSNVIPLIEALPTID